MLINKELFIREIRMINKNQEKLKLRYIFIVIFMFNIAPEYIQQRTQPKTLNNYEQAYNDNSSFYF